MSIHNIIISAGDFIKKNSPTILTTTAVAGVISTAVLAARGHRRAMLNLKVRAMAPEKDVGDDTALQKAMFVWHHYAPAAVIGGLTIASIFGLNTVHTKRAAILAGAYSIAERALDEYKHQVELEHGSDGMDKIHDRVAKAQAANTPMDPTQEIVYLEPDDVLCFDPYSGRYFSHSIEKLKRIENILNQRLINSHFLSLNDLYSEIGLDPIALGDDVGWVPDNLIIMNFHSAITAQDLPCIVMRYEVEPSIDKYLS